MNTYFLLPTNTISVISQNLHNKKPKNFEDLQGVSKIGHPGGLALESLQKILGLLNHSSDSLGSIEIAHLKDAVTKIREGFIQKYSRLSFLDRLFCFFKVRKINNLSHIALQQCNQLSSIKSISRQ